MEYYSLLNLDREPFSNSPDPDFFYPSHQHRGCLQQVELAIRLRRGLNVIIGDVGTGKTTLCRDLVRRFADDEALDAHLMLDPGATSQNAFLAAVLELLSGTRPPADGSEDRCKEAIKQHLFERAVEQQRTVVLIIDEGQKLTAPCLELLREFLNYETNAHKLLQIVIFAQKEFEHTLRTHANVADRVNLRLELSPLGFRDTLALIAHRIRLAGGGSAAGLFSLPALMAIFVATRGYPRRIIHLCHRILLALIIQNRKRAGWRLVRASAQRTILHDRRRRRWVAAAGLLVLTAVLAPALRGGLPMLFRSAPTPAAPHAAPAEPFQAAQEAAGGFPSAESATGPAPDPPVANHHAGSGTILANEAPGWERAGHPVNAAPTSFPARLGRVSIAPGETLGQLIETIYGRFTPDALKAVAAANPHIADPDALSVGDVVHFPALPAAVRPLPVRVWWARLSEQDRLADAVRALKHLRQDGVSARLLSYWNGNEGLVFALVLAECFFDRGAATGALQSCPAAAGARSAVCSLYREDTVYFSDPFRAGGNRNSNPS